MASQNLSLNLFPCLYVIWVDFGLRPAPIQFLPMPERPFKRRFFRVNVVCFVVTFGHRAPYVSPFMTKTILILTWLI